MESGAGLKAGGAAHRRPLHSFAARLFALLMMLLASSASAEITRFTADISQTEVGVGEPVTLTIQLEADSYIPSRWPEAPDFGDLRVVAGPIQEQRQSISNGQLTISFITRYTLMASEPGVHTIGSTTYEYGGRTYRTDPLQLTVNEGAGAQGLPDELTEEKIVHPVTTDASVNQQLRGRLFVRTEVTDGEPYVGEPVIVTYDLYQDQVPRLLQVEMVKPELESMLVDPAYEARSIGRGIVQSLGGRQYEVTPLYQIAVTPTRPGEFDLEGFELRFQLPVTTSRRTQSFFDSFFNQTIPVIAAASPTPLSVQPLPEAGKPSGFTGTVGDFEIDAQIDQESLSQDDLVTLRVTIEGTGNIDLAAVPEYTGGDNFELYDTLQATQKEIRDGRLWGRRVIEYLLRPRKTGNLEIPPVQYPIFDPLQEEYRTLTTSPFRVEVTAGAGGARIASANGAAEELPEIDRDLNYIEPVFELRREPIEPLAENPGYWALQLLAIGAVGGLFVRQRRQGLLTRGERRRRGAWNAFEKRLKDVRRTEHAKQPQEAAEHLEDGLRHFVADWFDVSPEGMTVPEVGERLREAGMSADSAARIEEILAVCAQIRYAPPGSGAAEFSGLAAEARQLLEKELR